eukprot:scaffold144723_cov118-Phaeocystis_antarctica.AAC.1
MMLTNFEAQLELPRNAVIPGALPESGTGAVYNKNQRFCSPPYPDPDPNLNPAPLAPTLTLTLTLTPTRWAAVASQ